MSKQRKTVAKRAKVADHRELPAYGDLVGGIAEVLEAARRASARAVNAVMTATASRKSPAQPTGKHATLPRISGGEPLTQIAARFPLPWSAYVRLLAVKNENARSFYETEALRAGWSVRQLDR